MVKAYLVLSDGYCCYRMHEPTTSTEAILNAFICKLPDRQREVIISYYWVGQTITEIAVSMEVSKQAVSKTMKAALSKLMANLINGTLQKRVIAAREADSILWLTRG